MKTIDVKDALALEELEQVGIRNRIVRRAIRDTYGKKSATKKRRKLPGKRQWKNKDEQYKDVEGVMVKNEFNARQKAIRALKNIEKMKAKQRKKHSLY